MTDPLLPLLDTDRRSLSLPGRVIELLPDLTRRHSVTGSHHEVSFSSLDEATADAVIAREIAHHARLGVEFEWKVYSHDPPPDLLDRLRRHGFEIGPREAVMVLPLDRRPDSLREAPHDWITAAPEHNVTRVETPEQIATYRQVAEAVFAKDYSFTANELAAALREGSPPVAPSSSAWASPTSPTPGPTPAAEHDRRMSYSYSQSCSYSAS